MRTPALAPLALGLVLVLSSLAASPALAAPIVFAGNLSGPAEEPPNASPGTGTAAVTIDPEAHTMRVEAAFADLLAVTTAAHIHVINGPGDLNLADTVGPVATAVPFFPGFPIGVTAGDYDQTFDTLAAGTYNPSFITNSGGTTALAEAELFEALFEGRAYFNIHSIQFPGGEIRGFLAQQVPAPASAGLLAAAVGLLVAVRHAAVRRRRTSR